MDSIKRNTVEGWIDKASKQLMFATEKAKSPYYYSECVQAAQQCVELSVKAALALLEIEYKPSHGWNKDQLEEIAKQIRDHEILDRLSAANLNYVVRLPRLLFLANFWAQFYIVSKYGLEAGYLASAKDVFDQAEADVAVRHAEECHRAACHIKCLPQSELAQLLSGKARSA